MGSLNLLVELVTLSKEFSVNLQWFLVDEYHLIRNERINEILLNRSYLIRVIVIFN
jgi:hypothetical protein